MNALPQHQRWLNTNVFLQYKTVFKYSTKKKGPQSENEDGYELIRCTYSQTLNVLFYTKYTHPALICRGTDTRTHAQKIFTQYSGISSCS